MRNESGTIAAISTAMSNSGIGIVRMSGEEAVEIAERIYKGKNEKNRKINKKKFGRNKKTAYLCNAIRKTPFGYSIINCNMTP